MARGIRPGPLSPGLVELREQIRAWRRTRKKLGAMPPELWSSAVGLAQEHGVYAVAKAVGVEYAALQRRTEAGDRSSSGPAGENSRAFVEVRPSPSSDVVAGGGTILELSDGGRRRMTIRVSSGASIEIDRVVAAFYGGGR